jgi:DMSO/TMAO reductase YedYZ molybdopterin-dependent catalytic subunit
MSSNDNDDIDIEKIDIDIDAGVDREIKRRSRRAFVTGGVAAALGVGAYGWLRTRPKLDGVAWPLRRVLESNESLARAMRYVAMETPGRGYYVGLDMESALHPQTLLVYEMNGAPLTLLHGAPLRLGIPVKYGIKNIKRIGTIRYTDVRPADFWGERGYDWYAGL